MQHSLVDKLQRDQPSTLSRAGRARGSLRRLFSSHGQSVRRQRAAASSVSPSGRPGCSLCVAFQPTTISIPRRLQTLRKPSQKRTANQDRWRTNATEVPVRNMDGLQKFLEDRNTSFQNMIPVVKPPEPEGSPDQRCRLCTTKNVMQDEVVTTIPEALAVTAYDARGHDLIGEIAQERDELIGITLWLLAETARGQESTWHALIESLPSASTSPLCWDPEERARLLQGSPALALAEERAAAVAAEYETLQGPLQAALADLGPGAASQEAFLRCFARALASVVFLPSAGLLALLPVVSSAPRAGSSGLIVDYDSASSSVVVKADDFYAAGEEVAIRDTQGRSNTELMLSCGQVDAGHSEDFLEYTVELVSTDRLYDAKREIIFDLGLQEQQLFPLYMDRFPQQLLSYVRLSRVQDPAELAKVSFERDMIVSEMNEYETLMLMMADVRERISLYASNLEDDLKLVQRSYELSAEEAAAAELRLQEKKILQATMDAIRKRLNPIRGIPTKAGKLEDPNADLLEVFDLMENGPQRVIGGFLKWARGDHDK